jgi:fibro-slime domain-containing protein
VCGDGLVIGEQCDDGNTKSGDGCSATCKKEPGFTCEQRGTCETVNGSCVLRVPVIYRDFTAEHPDFGVACVAQEATPGLLEKVLRTDGVPVATANASLSCITRVADWYSDAETKAIVRELALFDAGQGNFVNRYGAQGEQWATRPVYTGRFCGNGDTGCVAGSDFIGCDFNPELESCFYPCPAELGPPTDSCAGTASSPVKYDGTPLFFPLDDQPQTEPWRDAKLPAQYGYQWQWEDTVVPVYGAAHVSSKAAHNFNFTAQLVSWFRYTAAGVPPLDFSSDDDLWVFVNGKLAVDLGGVHQPAEATLTIDTTTAQNLGLTPGGVYRIDIFHAERKPESSSLRVTLPWFDLSRSVCEPL